jgi:hypothetical protein
MDASRGADTQPAGLARPSTGSGCPHLSPGGWLPTSGGLPQ